jgi:ATP-dependent Clp protease ATP-binding subunit ClpA
MFERFTERARQVIVLAQDEARTLGHDYIGTEHILLGLLREEDGLAARVLDSLDITVEEVRAQIARIVGQGDEVTTGQIPFTPRAKKVLELALREALSLGHNYIGTEHILLGLVRENEGVAARILLDFDADAEKIRNEIIRTPSEHEQAPNRDPPLSIVREQHRRDDGHPRTARRDPCQGRERTRMPELRDNMDGRVVCAYDQTLKRGHGPSRSGKGQTPFGSDPTCPHSSSACRDARRSAPAAPVARTAS